MPFTNADKAHIFSQEEFDRITNKHKNRVFAKKFMETKRVYLPKNTTRYEIPKYDIYVQDGYHPYLFNLRSNAIDEILNSNLTINDTMFSTFSSFFTKTVQKIYQLEPNILPFDLTANHGIDIKTNKLELEFFF